MKKLKFDELSLSPELLKAVADMGFEEASPIQSLAIPAVLTGRDIIGQAQTGTGKTAAFGIPLLEMLDLKDKRTQFIVLCPTRELAIQVAEELTALSKYKKGITILPVYGGQPIDRQIYALRKGVQIVIGTPGRVIDHLERRTLHLESVRMVVLDEADEMLDMGFRDDIEIILKSVPATRQTVFFSATMPKAFMELTARFQKNPQIIRVVHDKLTVPDIEQIYYEVKENHKMEVLTRVLDIYDHKLSLVFSNTKRKVDEIVSHLKARGYAAEGIHGDMNQSQRERVMSKFRAGTVEILVATDVAARGIDVENVEAVFNYDIPQDEEYYVHRIGRTGRAGKSGRAYSFAAGKDIYKLRDIQRYTKAQIQRGQVPSLKDVEQVRVTQFFDKVREVLEQQDLERYTAMLEPFIGDEYTSLDVAGALLKMALQPSIQPGEKDVVPSTVRLFISVGKKHKVRPGDILGAITGEAGVKGDQVGGIQLFDAYTLVEVPEALADKIISRMERRHIKGNRVLVRRAREDSSLS